MILIVKQLYSQKWIIISLSTVIYDIYSLSEIWHEAQHVQTQTKNMQYCAFTKKAQLVDSATIIESNSSRVKLSKNKLLFLTSKTSYNE
jgi:hypothetical protein